MGDVLFQMNLPNKLTIVRIIMIPFFVFFLLTDFVAGSKWITTVLFCAASIYDFFMDILQESIIL